MRQLLDTITSISYLYFNSTLRNGNAALTANLSVFIANTSKALIITIDSSNSKREVPYLVFTFFILDK